MIRTPILALAAATLALGAAACNTVEGAGEDLQSASNEVEEEL
jgi:predicted small secreted protein